MMFDPKRIRVYHFEVFKRVFGYAKMRVFTSPFIEFKSREMISTFGILHSYGKVYFSGLEGTWNTLTEVDNNCLFVIRFDSRGLWPCGVQTSAVFEVHRYITVRIIDDIKILARHDSLREWK